MIRAVRQLAKRGVDIIEIMVSGGLMTVGRHIPSGRKTLDAQGRGTPAPRPRALILESSRFTDISAHRTPLTVVAPRAARSVRGIRPFSKDQSVRINGSVWNIAIGLPNCGVASLLGHPIHNGGRPGADVATR